MHINWYPGHMKKTRELIQNNLKLVDVVIELLDARIPISSKNPNIDELLGNKPRVIVLNKSDLSDPYLLKEWIKYYEKLNIHAIPYNSLSGGSSKELMDSIKSAASEKIKVLEKKGRENRPLRLMIVGIPNVGKSSFINNLAGKKSAKTGNKPGVTRGKQWIRLRKDLELFDTPGILWPKIEDLNVGLKLAFTGAIKDEILDGDEITLKLIESLIRRYPSYVKDRYKLSEVNDNPLTVMEDIAVKRGCIRSGGELDYTKVSNIVLDEFRKGKIGKITLEGPNDLNQKKKD